MKLFEEKNYLEKYTKYVFFYGGYLSNWADTPFMDTDTWIHYNTSEQYMMHQKALLFRDNHTAQMIMNTKSPREQKALGRLVKNFNKSIWEEYARQIVYEGCYYKFTQNKSAYDYLIGTAGTYLVEASPTDTVWGVGLTGPKGEIEDPKNWQGTNWLGQVLTQLRDDILTTTTKEP
jgi:ribA/ribD-fused uncharacterized protein